jgi:hypothetical protein
MGLSLQEANLLGIGHLHPAMSRGRSAERELLERIEPQPSRRVLSLDGALNRTERAFWHDVRLSPLIRQIAREPVTFRLAGRTRYTPDFGIWPEPASDWRFTLVEVKGFMRDDAAVKIKVAADLFPQFRWLLVYREKGGGWRVHNVDRNGIGRKPIVVSWINGVV